MLYSRSLLTIYPIYNSANMPVPNLPSIPHHLSPLVTISVSLRGTLILIKMVHLGSNGEIVLILTIIWLVYGEYTQTHYALILEHFTPIIFFINKPLLQK